MSADGTAPEPTGASILTSNLPPPPAPGSAEAAVQGVVDGPPEWAPAKFWDSEKKAVKYEDLGKGYQNLEKLLGREKVPVPIGDDDEEGWQRWYAATGRPDKADDYEFQRPDKLPDGMPYDEELEKEYRQWAHINGLSKKQANNFYDGFVKRQVERHSAYHTHQMQARSKIESDMRREFGAQYEGKVQQAKSALAKYADPEYLKYLDETGLGNDPRTIRSWIKIGDEMGGSTKLKGTPAVETAPADIDRAISEYKSKNEKAYWNNDHPDHRRVVTEMERLYQMRFAEMGAR